MKWNAPDCWEVKTWIKASRSIGRLENQLQEIQTQLDEARETRSRCIEYARDKQLTGYAEFDGDIYYIDPGQTLHGPLDVAQVEEGFVTGRPR